MVDFLTLGGIGVFDGSLFLLRDYNNNNNVRRIYMDFIGDDYFHDNLSNNDEECGEEQPLLQGDSEFTYYLFDYGEVAVGSKRDGRGGLQFGFDGLSLSDFEEADEFESQGFSVRRHSFSGFASEREEFPARRYSFSGFATGQEVVTDICNKRSYSFSGYDLVSAILVLLIIAIVVAILAWLIIKWNHPL